MANTRTLPSGARNYSATINENHASPAFNFLYDRTNIWGTPDGRTFTGGWRAAVPADFAANVSVSGITLQVGAVAVTGITQTSIVDPILPISGVVTILGGSSSSNGSVQITGNSLVGITGVTNVTGNIFSNYPGSTSVSNSTVSGANGTVLSENLNRKQWFIQNLGTGFLYVKLGTAASSTSFNFILKGASTPSGSDGSIFSDDGARWRGAVSVSGITTPSYINWELV